MPRSPDESTPAQQAADDACAFFDRCIANGRTEQQAGTLTTAYILGRLRQPEKREPWEFPED